MIVYHVTTFKKLSKYRKAGHIKPPVRAWETLAEAERFSISTGRRVILRLKFPDAAAKLEGHRNLALVLLEPLPFSGY